MNSNICSTARPSIPASRGCSGAWASSASAYKDLNTQESSLEDIFVSLVHAPAPEAAA